MCKAVIILKEEALIYGSVVRQLRKDKKWSQEQLSLEADMDRSFLSEIERGVKQPTISTIFSLANALGMKPSELMRLVEDRIQ